MSVVVGLVCLILVLVFAASWYFSLSVSDRPRYPHEKALAEESAIGFADPDFWATVPKEDFSFESQHGYTLNGFFIPTQTPEFLSDGKRFKKVLVFTHGHGYNLIGGLKYYRHFLDRGFDVYLYDLRACGTSGGKRVSMGMFEKDDLETLLSIIRNEYGDDLFLGSIGESMGGATVILQAATYTAPDFVISDCSYSDLRDELAWKLKDLTKLPSFPIIDLASLINKFRVGYWYKEISPVRLIKEKDGLPEVPILFVHGEDDTYILPKMAHELFASKKGITGLILVPNAKHASSVGINPTMYMTAVDSFLAEVIKAKSGKITTN